MEGEWTNVGELAKLLIIGYVEVNSLPLHGTFITNGCKVGTIDFTICDVDASGYRYFTSILQLLYNCKVPTPKS